MLEIDTDDWSRVIEEARLVTMGVAEVIKSMEMSVKLNVTLVGEMIAKVGRLVGIGILSSVVIRIKSGQGYLDQCLRWKNLREIFPLRLIPIHVHGIAREQVT